VLIKTLSGQEIERYIQDLAHLRMEVFRDWPYLYEGDEAYERKYLETLVAEPRAVLIVVEDDGEIVGASTALPLAGETDEFTRPFSNAGLDPGEYFYLGESVLRGTHRGRGLGHRFFDEREAAARMQGYVRTCFAAVQRPPDHPSRPPDYRPLDPFWQKRGYRPRPDLMTTFSWRDVGEAEETEKPMMFWTRILPAVR
jgi:GNAT superfamily N-acetyltransferase